MLFLFFIFVLFPCKGSFFLKTSCMIHFDSGQKMELIFILFEGNGVIISSVLFCTCFPLIKFNITPQRVTMLLLLV